MVYQYASVFAPVMDKNCKYFAIYATSGLNGYIGASSGPYALGTGDLLHTEIQYIQLQSL